MQKAFNRDKAQEEGIIVPEKGVIKEYDDAICNAKECVRELDLYLNVIRKQLHCSVNSLFYIKVNDAKSYVNSYYRDAFQNINFFGSGRSRYQLEIPETVAMNLGHEFELKSSRRV